MSEFYKKIKANVESHKDRIKNSPRVKEVLEAVKLKIEERSELGKNSFDFKMKEYFDEDSNELFYEFKRQIEELGFRVDTGHCYHIPISRLDENFNIIKDKPEEPYTSVTVNWYRDVEYLEKKKVEPKRSWLCDLF